MAEDRATGIRGIFLSNNSKDLRPNEKQIAVTLTTKAAGSLGFKDGQQENGAMEKWSKYILDDPNEFKEHNLINSWGGVMQVLSTTAEKKKVAIPAEEYGLTVKEIGDVQDDLITFSDDQDRWFLWDLLDGEIYRIRKITEREAWRLMDFSDEDFEKAAAVNSTAQLYKQAGNSICRNVLCRLFKELIEE